MAKVVAGISGGVDSAVAAYLLKEQGHDVCGVFMRNWDEENDESGLCTGAQDYEDARACCLALDIPFYSVDFTKEYWDRVFAYFLSEYAAARTPNPDVLCNSEIKFKAFLDYAKAAFGAELIATGHYANAHTQAGRTALYKGADQHKDQSYFLSFLTEAQLASALFPLGGMQKSEVRALAKKLGLRVADKKDSTGICFIGERNFRKFLPSYLPARPGDILDWDSGKAIGRHNGLMYYTIGQRRGLGIGNLGTGQRWYVASKDVSANTLLCVEGEGNPKLYCEGFCAKEYNFIGYDCDESFECMVKYRYMQEEKPARATFRDGALQIAFQEKQAGVAPGQVGALYIGQRCLGGAIIDFTF